MFSRLLYASRRDAGELGRYMRDIDAEAPFIIAFTTLRAAGPLRESAFCF